MSSSRIASTRFQLVWDFGERGVLGVAFLLMTLCFSGRNYSNRVPWFGMGNVFVDVLKALVFVPIEFHKCSYICGVVKRASDFQCELPTWNTT